MSDVDLKDVAARQSRLAAAVSDLAELPWTELPTDVTDSVLVTLESAQRTPQSIGGDAINRLRAEQPGRTRRVRDHLANLLHISATEAGARIATAADLTGAQPTLPETPTAPPTNQTTTTQTRRRLMRDAASPRP